ncbi:MAG: hypothetical protein FD123_3727 [Bacteroidetes bacterium]|nr:MAG: hypothetical protein FD123_3727 [Bacteroidota bacterium]
MKKIKIQKKLTLTKQTVNRLQEGLENVKGGVITVTCCASKCNTNWTCIG